MSAYSLGVDLGTTWTGAALARDGQIIPCTLESHQTLVPSLVHVAADGTWTFGPTAERRAAQEPDGLARAFKRKFGDPVPEVLSGTPASIQDLTGRLLAWTVGVVAQQEGEAPELVVVTHPAHWSEQQRSMLRAAAQQHLDGTPVALLTEPEAIAVHYATEKTPPDGKLAVYDFGGGTFDVTVLSSSATGFRVIGEPMGRDRVGGIDLDDRIVSWVLDRLGDDVVARLDRSDPLVQRALRRLRADAVVAKEALSSETETEIEVGLPTARETYRLTRTDFEGLVAPLVDETITAVEEACARADCEVSELSLLLLAGGSSRVPLVAEVIARRLGVATESGLHPKLSVALGAAGSTLPIKRPVPAPQPAPPAAVPPGGADVGEPPTPGPPAVDVHEPAPVPIDRVDSSVRRAASPRSFSPRTAGIGVVAAVVVAAIAFVLWPRGSDPDAATSTTTVAPSLSVAGGATETSDDVVIGEVDEAELWQAQVVSLFNDATGDAALRGLLNAGFFSGNHMSADGSFGDDDCVAIQTKLARVAVSAPGALDRVPRTGEGSVYPSLGEIELRPNIASLWNEWNVLYDNCVCTDSGEPCLIPGRNGETAGQVSYAASEAGRLQEAVLSDICFAFDGNSAARFSVTITNGTGESAATEVAFTC